jgi:hypothetical protein
MNFIFKKLWKAEYIYQSDKSIDELKSEIQQLLKKTEGWNFSVNLTGYFVSEYEFKMTPKWSNLVIKGPIETQESYLKGRLYKHESNKTRITFTVRPNIIFLIFFFSSPIFGISILTYKPSNGQQNDMLVFGLGLTFIIPFLMLIIGHYFQKTIKDRFVSTFDLKQVK